jgi:hypothetical protein
MKVGKSTLFMKETLWTETQFVKGVPMICVKLIMILNVLSVKKIGGIAIVFVCTSEIYKNLIRTVTLKLRNFANNDSPI